jgi:hypothetical protein
VSQTELSQFEQCPSLEAFNTPEYRLLMRDPRNQNAPKKRSLKASNPSTPKHPSSSAPDTCISHSYTQTALSLSSETPQS